MSSISVSLARRWATRGALILVLFVVMALLVPMATPARAASKTSFTDLPPTAQSLVSTTLGNDDATYHFQPTANGYQIENATTALRADFSNMGMNLRLGDAQWTLALQAMGYGDQLQAVSQVAPTAVTNRLEYARELVTEWFVNGPAGLEQGWTLAQPPATRDGTGLTLALAVAGNARMNGNALALLRADGTVALNYTGLTAYDATGRELRAWMEMGAGEMTSPLRIRVDDANAQYPLTIDPWVQSAKLITGAGTEYLGVSVAVSGDGSTIVAGAQFGFSGSPAEAKGAAYVFVKSSSWISNTATAQLIAYDGAASDWLGYSVGISGDGSVIAAGAPNKVGGQGAVYVFRKPGSWGGILPSSAKLTATDGTPTYGLGWSVAVSGDGLTIVAGALNAQIGSNDKQGAAYVFVKPDGVWNIDLTENTKLVASDGAANNYLGYSVAVRGDGSTIVVGAYNVTIGSNAAQGAAYVFDKPGGGWGTPKPQYQTAKLTASDGLANALLGISVAMSNDGSTIVGGAYGDNSSQGAAYVFVKPGGGWATGTQTAKLTASDGAAYDNLGASVGTSVDGSTIVVGGYNIKIGSNASQGAAYVFVKSSSWVTNTETATLTASDGAAGDRLGNSVAIDNSSKTIVAGAYGFNTYQGAAYVFYNPTATAVTLSSFQANAPFDLGAWIKSFLGR